MGIVGFVMRVCAAIALNMAFEHYWFNVHHFCGYSSFVNKHPGISERDVFIKYDRLNQAYTIV
jgi:hypothetical protein